MIRNALLVLTIATAGPALAQPYPYPYPPPGYYPAPAPPRTYRGVYPNPYAGPDSGRVFGAPAAYCQKLCTQDFAPCDPPEFKRADGRCNNPTGRLF